MKAPSGDRAALNTNDPANESITFSAFEDSGETIGIIIKRNIPIPNESKTDNQVVCLQITLIKVNIVVKIGTRKTLLMTQATMLPALKEPKSKDNEAIPPPINEPRK